MNAIVYTSNSGFTAQYAEMLGAKLSLPVYKLADAPNHIAKGADIIYLGWLMAGVVKGYKKATKLYQIKAVCSVGMGANGSQLDLLQNGGADRKAQVRQVRLSAYLR